MTRNSIRRRTTALLAGLAVVAGGVALGATAAADVAPEPTYGVEVSAAEVRQGGTVEVTVTASDVVDLYAYDLVLEVDPKVLALVPKSATSSASGATYGEASGGTVRVLHTKLGSSPAASGEVVTTVTFRAVGAGQAAVKALSFGTVSTDLDTSTAEELGSASVTVTRGRG